MNDRTRPASEGAGEVGRRYMAAFAAGDAVAMAAMWRPGGVDRIVGQAEVVAPGELLEFFTSFFAAFPDLRVNVVEETASETGYWVRWEGRGTFSGSAPYNGIEPNGASIETEGCDCLRIEDGLIVANTAYVDGATFARQIGMLPGEGSLAERVLRGSFNTLTTLRRRFRPRSQPSPRRTG